MYRARVIPCLLLSEGGLVKTKRFKDPVYVGDPINAVRIFSEKEVDELVVLDIDATRERREPNYDLIAEIAGECFMPVAYGGGVRTLNQVRKLIRTGIEKVVINSAAIESTEVITAAAEVFGCQAVMVAVDVRKTLLGGYKVVSHSAMVENKVKLEDHVNRVVLAGAGEVLLTSVDRDGMMTGYDLELIKRITQLTNVPVIAAGGAGTVEHLRQAVQHAGASAVSAGSMFVFHGKHRAVLINYPADLRL
jgi:imidazole glycerol-phosphate synthase subunit HisF